jgi:hypothetical protein
LRLIVNQKENMRMAMAKPEKVKLEVTLERPQNGKGKGVAYGDLIAYVKEAIEAHGASNSIAAPLTNVKVKRVTA